MKLKLLLSTLLLSTVGFSQIIYVDATATGNNDGTSWANAHTKLERALDFAINNQEIWIAKGTYKPSVSTRNAPFFIDNDNLRIYGGFAGTETQRSDRDFALIHTTNETILSGDLNGDDNANITFVNNTRIDNSVNIVYVNRNGVIIDGITIANGHADAVNGNGRTGSGLKTNFNNVYNFTIRNSKIINNVAFWGAGLSLTPGIKSTANNSITIEACIFENNLATSSSAFYFLPSLITNTFLTVNFTVVNNLFYNNKTSDDIFKNPIRKGLGSPAGWIRSYNRGIIEANVVNNTFVNNKSDGTGASVLATFGISADSGSLSSSSSVANNIFWGNTTNGSSIANSISKVSDTKTISGSQIFNSIAQDNFIGYSGTTNTASSNPNLDPNSKLRTTSNAARDEGDNSKTPTSITKDLDGNDRIINSRVDIGAYEFDAATASVLDENKIEFSMFPNPTNGILNVALDSKVKNISIYNLLGKKVKTFETKSIDISSLPKGIYALKLETENGKTGIQKIIKE